MAKRANNPWQERFEILQAHGGTAVAATGLITCVTNANMADSDYITIGDGVNPALLFEYDKSANGVTSGRVSVTAGAGTAAQTAAAFATAITANMPALTVTDNLDGTLTIAHKIPGAAGNVTITENVANAGFTVSGMSGGVNAGEAASTISVKMLTAQRTMRVEKIEYVNPTGLAGHASNYWTIALLKNGTVIGSWSTATAAQSTLTANAIVNLVLSATDADLVLAAGDVLSYSLTKAASAANLPGGRLAIHGRYV